MVLKTLIDKQDTFEIVRDQIAALLVLEVENQKVLAVAAGKDPADWQLDVYQERSNPFEKWRDDDGTNAPIVNIVFDSLTTDDSGSTRSNSIRSTGLYNIFCYGHGISKDNTTGGHYAGDKVAALEAQRAIRLVRNILFASENTYLQLQQTVFERRLESIEVFQPTFGENTVQNVLAARLMVRVVFNEFSPQEEPVELELLSVDIKRAEDGQLIAEADYDYTL